MAVTPSALLASPHRVLAALALTAGSFIASFAEPNGAGVAGVHSDDDAPTWAEDVRPILSEHCFACHGPDLEARAAGLRLDTRAGMLAGEAFDLAAPEESELLYRVVTDEEFDHMPPADAGRSLNAGEIDTLRRWIESGAGWEPHWAYAPFERLETPDSPQASTLDIDARVESKLSELGLTMNPEAAPRDLLRRLYFDIIGMPPTAEEL